MKNLQITGALLNEGYYDDISDHKCLKVTLKIGERPPPIQLKNHSISSWLPRVNEENFKYLLSQTVLRKLANSEETVVAMLAEGRVIENPTYMYLQG